MRVRRTLWGFDFLCFERRADQVPGVTLSLGSLGTSSLRPRGLQRFGWLKNGAAAAPSRRGGFVAAGAQAHQHAVRPFKLIDKVFSAGDALDVERKALRQRADLKLASVSARTRGRACAAPRRSAGRRPPPAVAASHGRPALRRCAEHRANKTGE